MRPCSTRYSPSLRCASNRSPCWCHGCTPSDRRNSAPCCHPTHGHGARQIPASCSAAAAAMLMVTAAVAAQRCRRAMMMRRHRWGSAVTRGKTATGASAGESGCAGSSASGCSLRLHGALRESARLFQSLCDTMVRTQVDGGNLIESTPQAESQQFDNATSRDGGVTSESDILSPPTDLDSLCVSLDRFSPPPQVFVLCA